ncbi:hypothetical protein Tco_0761681, partial [Tanacetum coccineum]
MIEVFCVVVFGSVCVEVKYVDESVGKVVDGVDKVEIGDDKDIGSMSVLNYGGLFDKSEGGEVELGVWGCLVGDVSWGEKWNGKMVSCVGVQ